MINLTSKIRILIYQCLLVMPLAVSAAVDEREVITFGIVPQQSAAKLLTNWSPLLKQLSLQTGYQLMFRTAPDIPTFEKRVLQGEYDIAYMNPYHYAVYSANPGYRAFARQKDKRIQGVIVVRKDSGINTLKDLLGEELAFPSPAAFAASMLPRAELTKLKINFTEKYVGSHDSVYKSVAKGLYPAGGGIQRTLNAADESIIQQLKVLWLSDKFTPHAFAVHPRVKTEVMNAVQASLIKMSDTEEGRKLLANIKFMSVEAATDAEWNDVRLLNKAEPDWLLKGNK